MKKFAFLLLLPVGAVSAQEDASTYPVATINADYCVQLDAAQEIQSLYQIDIAPFGFTTFEDAYAQFGRISNNLLTYSVDIAEQRVVLEVHIDRTDVPKTSYGGMNTCKHFVVFDIECLNKYLKRPNFP